ncbi:MAG: capsular polysaccharide synthesis protein [Chitinophagales bacterium]
MDSSNIIHTLWIGDSLSAMEELMLKSFQYFNCNVNLWTYKNSLTVPDGIIIKDANEIIPEHKVFSYKSQNKYGHGKGSLSGFSDIFRYKLLFEKGGIWVDSDVTCLKEFKIEEPYFFRFHHQIGLVGNVLKADKNAPLMEWCYNKAIQLVDRENTNWLLPIEILKEGVYYFNLQKYIHDISNPDSFPVVREMYLNNNRNIVNWTIIHWMNEEFRRMNIDKNKVVRGSHYQQLLDKHKIDYNFATPEEIKLLKWKTSKLNYSILNLISRYNWYKRKLFDNF